MVYSSEYFALLNDCMTTLANAYCFSDMENCMRNIEILTKGSSKLDGKMEASTIKMYQRNLSERILRLNKMGTCYNEKDYPDYFIELDKTRFLHCLESIIYNPDPEDFVFYKEILFKIASNFFKKINI